MFRKLLAVMVLMLCGIGVLLADEAKGKVKGKYEKGKLTLTVGDKDTEFMVTKDAKVTMGDTDLTGKDRGKALRELKEGTEVTVTFKKDGDKIIVESVKWK